MPSKGKLKVFQKQEIHYFAQTLTTTLKFIETNKNGTVIQEEYSEWTTRYTFLYELEYLIELCNLKIKEKYGSYTEQPIDEDSHMVFVLSK